MLNFKLSHLRLINFSLEYYETHNICAVCEPMKRRRKIQFPYHLSHSLTYLFFFFFLIEIIDVIDKTVTELTKAEVEKKEREEDRLGVFIYKPLIADRMEYPIVA